jgi:hypothetical protein
MQSPSKQERWTRIWESKGGIWNVLTESEFKQFPLEQLARHWAAGQAVEA